MSASDPVYRKDVQEPIRQPLGITDLPMMATTREPNWKHEYLELRRRISRVQHQQFVDEMVFQMGDPERLSGYLEHARKSAVHSISRLLFESGAVVFTDYTPSEDDGRPFARQMTAEVRVIMPGPGGKLSFEHELDLVARRNQKTGFQKARHLVRDRSSWSSLQDVRDALADFERSM